MYLELDEEFVVKTLDPNNLGLCQKVVRKNKDTKEDYEDLKVIGYYGTLEVALKGYLKYKIRFSEVDTADRLIELIENVNKTISALPEAIKKLKAI